MLELYRRVRCPTRKSVKAKVVSQVALRPFKIIPTCPEEGRNYPLIVLRLRHPFKPT